MLEPRLRKVNKATPPFALNEFPSQFIETFASEIAYLLATKENMSLEGNEWEQIFAHCVGADWRPSNVGLDDIILQNCCWGAKTVFAGSKNIQSQNIVRLISGRNSPIYSFGEGNIVEANPNYIGKLVLAIWNERVSSVRQIFKFVRTAVLVKSKDFSEFMIFETDTTRYDPELYEFKWNSRGNLEGYAKSDEFHEFTWQPHGSQFTIIEQIPEERLHLSIQKPKPLDKQTVLTSLGFDSSWVTIIK